MTLFHQYRFVMPRALPFALSAAPLLLSAPLALADLTPDEVWSDWQSYLEQMGYAVDGVETSSGEGLRVDDVTMTLPMPEDEGAVTVSIESLSFLPNDSGGVDIVMPDKMPMMVSGLTDGPGSEAFEMVATYTQTDHALTASGSAAELTYDYTAGAAAIGIDSLVVDDQPLPNDLFRVNFALTGISTNTVIKTGDIRDYTATGSMASLNYDIFFEDPEDTSTTATFNGQASDLELTGTTSIPISMAATEGASEMLRAGFAFDTTLTYAGGASEIDVQDQLDGSFAMQSASETGRVQFGMSPSAVSYNVGQTGLDVSVRVDGIPVPFEVGAAESGFGFSMPTLQSEEAQDFSLGLTLNSLALSDTIWGIFDAAGQLPRDPATLILDLTGQVKLMVDWFDPRALAMLASDPGALVAANLNELTLEAAGARLDGDGALTFDGSGAPMVPGIGNPVGEVNMMLAGGNALLDRLIAMGIVPQEQAMGARMMMGLFAVPGDAPDTLKSKLEFTQDGQILANGQRIR